MNRLSGRILLIWCATVAAVVSTHFMLDALGVVHAGKGFAEAALTATMMVGFYLFLRHGVTRPLKDLTRSAGRIAAGDLSARSEVDWPPEFSELSAAMNAMAERLKDNYDELKAANTRLEDTVRERTHDLEVEREKLDAIFRSMPDGVIFVSVSGEVEEFNPEVETIFGENTARLKGHLVEELPEGPLRDSLISCGRDMAARRCWEVHGCNKTDCPAHGSDDPRCWLVSGTFCRTGVQTSVRRKRLDICSTCEVYLDAMDRCAEVTEIEVSGRHYKVTRALVTDAGRKVIGHITSFYDFTTERLLEVRKAELTSLVTHDLKSPLTSIIGYAELIRSSPAVDSTEYAEAITRSSRRILELVEQFLDISKMESGTSDMRLEELDPAALIRDVAIELLVQANERGITLKQEVGRLPGLRGDHGRLARALTNIVSNAVKFSPAGGEVMIAAWDEAGPDGSGRLNITVTNSGDGIPEDELQHIFDRYYRAKAASRTKGTGLGLSAVKSFIEAHGGEVAVTSRPGEGTTFTIIIPRVTS